MSPDAMRATLAAALAFAAALAACSDPAGTVGGSGCFGNSCGTTTPASPNALTEADVRKLVGQAVFEAQARGVHAHVAVVDRMGNVLAVFSMPGAPATIAITSGLGVSGGLDGIAQGTVPAPLAAIAKAITGAYLSSQGNAFTTRTAGQIIQEHFNPGELGQPAGPLYGVQFSQLSCSDINRNATQGAAGPQRSPLGLAADPGGLPVYKGGVLVGGIGAEADGIYTFDRDIEDTDTNDEELVAVAGSTGYAAPDAIRANRITADGRTLRYVDSESIRSNPANAPDPGTQPGSFVAVDGYVDATVHAGVAYGAAGSGVRADDAAFATQGGWIVTDAANANRFPPAAAAGGGLGATEVTTLMSQALAIGQRARGQIRQPLGSTAQVSIAVVDVSGNVLGIVRTPDGPLFGIDVAVQKARTAAFFSTPGAADAMRAFLPAHHIAGTTPVDVSVAQYLDNARTFLGDPAAFTGATAWSARAIGNIHRPFYPDGIDGAANGPFSTPIAHWSPFNVGFQLDLVYNQFVKGILGDTSQGCASRVAAGATAQSGENYAPLRNGTQIFPGGVPVYRGNKLVGAIGVSGDGVDQDDMVAFLGLANASQALGGAIGNAPAAMRADQLAPQGARLRYVQCPQAPFNDSTAENVCAGL